MTLSTEQQAQKDAAIASAQLDFAIRCRALAVRFEGGFSDAQALLKEYFDNGYNTGGPAEIPDTALSGLRFEPADLVAFVALLEQVANMATNQPVSSADYWATVNRIK